MSITLAHLTHTLANSLEQDDPVKARTILDRALVVPYGFEEGDPAELILSAGKASGNKALLGKLVAEKIILMPLDKILSQDDPAQGFMHINTLFDLARDLFLDEQVLERKEVLKVLEEVWKNHIKWRKALGKTFLEGETLLSWVDPATTAEESLLVLMPKPSPVIKDQIYAISRLDTPLYPAPMADYAFYFYFIYSVEKYNQENNHQWAETAGYIFGRRATVWYRDNRFLLHYALNHALDIIGEQDQKKVLLVDSLKSFSACRLSQKMWVDLQENCPALQQYNKALCYNHACALSLLGKQEEAVSELRLLLQSHPSKKEEVEQDEDFASLRNLKSYEILLKHI